MDSENFSQIDLSDLDDLTDRELKAVAEFGDNVIKYDQSNTELLSLAAAFTEVASTQFKKIPLVGKYIDDAVGTAISTSVSISTQQEKYFLESKPCLHSTERFVTSAVDGGSGGGGCD